MRQLKEQRHDERYRELRKLETVQNRVLTIGTEVNGPEMKVEVRNDVESGNEKREEQLLKEQSHDECY